MRKASADWFMRGALTRIGDTIDRFMGRKWTPSSSLATSELIERLKRLLDAEAKEVPGKGTVVPHNIKLKMQWDKFSTDSEDALNRLEVELLTAAADHVNDNLYYTTAPLIVKAAPDYFTEGVKLYVSFDSTDTEDSEVEMNVTMPVIHVKDVSTQAAPQAGRTFLARYTIQGADRDKKLSFPAGGRLSVGRTGGNDLILDDGSVSKIHASLALLGHGQLSVADTGSTNGTFINGERIAYGKANRLTDGDKVKFGEVEVQFEPMMKVPPAGLVDDVAQPPGPNDSGLEDEQVARFETAVADKTLEIPPATEPDPPEQSAPESDHDAPGIN